MLGTTTSAPFYIPAFIPRREPATAPLPERVKRYATTAIHSRGYYRSVLHALLDGLARGLSDWQVAQNLNALKIPTATGLEWSGDKVKTAYKKLRHHRRYPNRLYQAMTECVMWNELTHEQVMPLLLHRTRPGSM